ncbi:MAG: ABC transporter substrate-binding protein, partial [Firmicutes bacterium]|nr:ABC transporter substrate-binding protein [Bacillota bacterium]
MKTKKTLIALLCVLALMLGACSKDDANKVENQHGEEFTVTDEAVQVGTEGGDYEPYTITLNLERSGIGQNMEETFTSAPTHAIASGDQMADFFFDL